jgi:hypothetical protein
MAPEELTPQQKSDYFPLYLHVMRPISYSQLEEAFNDGEEDGLKKVLRHWPTASEAQAQQQQQQQQQQQRQQQQHPPAGAVGGGLGGGAGTTGTASVTTYAALVGK